MRCFFPPTFIILTIALNLVSLRAFPDSGIQSQDEKKTETGPVQSSLPLKLSGYTQLQFVEKNESPDTFSIKRARLSLSGNLLKKINFKIQVDLTKSPVLLDALAQVTFRPEFNIRAGQFLVPFSLESLTPVPELLTINRSQTVEKLAPGRDNGAIGRDIGVVAYGSYSLFEYAAGLVNGSGINRADNNGHKDIVGRLIARPFKAISLGFSFYDGRQTVTGNTTNLLRNKLGLEMAINYQRFNFATEFIQAQDGQTKKHGWYALGAYSAIKKKFQLVGRIDTINLNLTLPGEKTTIRTAGTNWFITSKSKIQVNYEYYREETGPNHHAALVQLQLGF